MFILGLAIGPALGLLVAEQPARLGVLGPRLTALLVALILFVFLVAGFLSLELRLGLIIGILAGWLLGSSPMEVPTPDSMA